MNKNRVKKPKSEYSCDRVFLLMNNSTHIATGVPRGARLRGSTHPPLNLQNFFELCVCKIYCPSSALILIKA